LLEILKSVQKSQINEFGKVIFSIKSGFKSFIFLHLKFEIVKIFILKKIKCAQKMKNSFFQIKIFSLTISKKILPRKFTILSKKINVLHMCINVYFFRQKDNSF